MNKCVGLFSYGLSDFCIIRIKIIIKTHLRYRILNLEPHYPKRWNNGLSSCNSTLPAHNSLLGLLGDLALFFPHR